MATVAALGAPDDFGESKDLTYQIDAAKIESSIIVEEEV